MIVNFIDFVLFKIRFAHFNWNIFSIITRFMLLSIEFNGQFMIMVKINGKMAIN